MTRERKDFGSGNGTVNIARKTCRCGHSGPSLAGLVWYGQLVIANRHLTRMEHFDTLMEHFVAPRKNVPMESRFYLPSRNAGERTCPRSLSPRSLAECLPCFGEGCRERAWC
jgi:hypothetical protein